MQSAQPREHTPTKPGNHPSAAQKQAQKASGTGDCALRRLTLYGKQTPYKWADTVTCQPMSGIITLRVCLYIVKNTQQTCADMRTMHGLRIQQQGLKDAMRPPLLGSMF